MNLENIESKSCLENEIAWEKAYRSIFKYGPTFPGCYINSPRNAAA